MFYGGTMSIKVLQLTDCHLFADPAQALKGVNTEQSFKQVLAQVAQAVQQPDLVLLTGDLAERGEISAYRRLLKHLPFFTCPIYAIPGNHDDVAVLRQVFSDSQITLSRSSIVGGWHFILLDSVLANHSAGQLASSELTFLQNALIRYAELPTLIGLHHHVQPVDGCMDAIKLKQSEEFLKIIARYKQVRVVLSGHTHQAFAQCIARVNYLTTPSTCYQIKAGAAAFIKDERLAPGYRWLTLHGDGTIDTTVERVCYRKVKMSVLG